MSEMTKEQKELYLADANAHVEFLCEKIFKPAFIMAFIHGVKHGREDIIKEYEIDSKLPRGD